MADRRAPTAIVAGFCAALAVAILVLASPGIWRERIFDLSLAAVAGLKPLPDEPRFAIVEIDAASLAPPRPLPGAGRAAARRDLRRQLGIVGDGDELDPDVGV